jgi:hypothetical protein
MLLQGIMRGSGTLRADKSNGKKWGGQERAFLILFRPSPRRARGRFQSGVAAMLLFYGRDGPWSVGRK